MKLRVPFLALTLLSFLLPLSYTGAQTISVDDEDRVVLEGNTHAATTTAEVVGRTNGAQKLKRMILSLKIKPAAQAALHSLITELQDPNSSKYHKWLTPEQFGAQFGPTQEEVDAATGWLKSQGFTVDEVTPSKLSVNFSGDAETVEVAFRTPMMDFRVDGEVRHANIADPSIPRALSTIVNGVVALHDIPRHTFHTDPKPLPNSVNQQVSAESIVVDGKRAMTPGDFATIYNLKPLYAAGIDGTGVSIAVIGHVNPPKSDIINFRKRFKLPANDPVYIFADGPMDPFNDGEADPDMEWAGSAAIKATIKFVTSDDVDIDAQYIVEHNVAPILTTSWGDCESLTGDVGNKFYYNTWAQAAAQGISVFCAAGDSGAANCEGGAHFRGRGQGVLATTSPPFAVAVGGTQFNEGSGTYWGSTTATDGSSALGYIPEAAWDSSNITPGGHGIWAGAGGVSYLYPKPSWQAVPGMLLDEHRSIPDVSLTASGDHDPYVIMTDGSLSTIGGTSLSAPALASIMALVVQKTGEWQGNPNPTFYRLARNQYLGKGPVIFHDIKVGNTDVRSVPGYDATGNYDMATGLGTVDGTALVNHWKEGSNTIKVTMTAPTSNQTVKTGTKINVSATGTDSAAKPLTFIWNFGDGGTAEGVTASHTYRNSGVSNVVYTIAVTATDSTGSHGSASRTVTVTPDLHAPRQLLINPNFDQADAGWTLNSFYTGDFEDLNLPSHGGYSSIWSEFSGMSSFYQQVTIPAGYLRATLSFWLHISKDPEIPSSAVDTMKVKVRDSKNAVLKTLATYSTNNSAPGYSKKTFDLSSYIGKTVQVYFETNESDDGATIFQLDEVNLDVRADTKKNISLEAETLARSSVGATSSVQVENRASGGSWVLLASDGVGDAIDLKLASVPAGTYRVKLLYKPHPKRAIMKLAIDGTVRSGSLDQYEYWPTFQTEADFGLVTFATTAPHNIRLSVSGKNPLSQGYNLSADAITLIPQ